VAVWRLRPSDTNRTYTPEVRFYQHSSLARLVGKAEPETDIQIGLPLRVSGTQKADEILQALDHRPDVVLGERGHWTTSQITDLAFTSATITVSQNGVVVLQETFTL
jgi:hypothetical protein